MSRTYCVTGAAGFLGCSVLKLLARESGRDVNVVKALDLYFPEEMKTAIESRSKGPEFQWITCDVTDYSQVLEALKGCDVVLHLASIIPGSFNDGKATMLKVNTNGTKNIVDACLENSVSDLVYFSSVSVIGPNHRREPAVNLTEDTPYDPGRRTFYGQTKKTAEDYVLGANGKHCASGKVMATCALRPGFIYGEFFRFFQAAKKSTKIKRIISIQSEDTRHTGIYVANMAWAVILAGKQLRMKKEIGGGQPYFVSDGTEPFQGFQMLANMMSPLGYKISRQPFLPRPLNYTAYSTICRINRALRNVGYSKTSLPQAAEVKRWDVVFTHSGQKFADHFSYQPLFSESEALKMTQRYVLRLNEINFRHPIYDYQYDLNEN